MIVILTTAFSRLIPSTQIGHRLLENVMEHSPRQFSGKRVC